MSDFNWREYVSLDVPNLIPAENAERMLIHFREHKESGKPETDYPEGVIRETYKDVHDRLDDPNFDISDIQTAYARAEGVSNFSDEMKSAVKASLNELASTPEGQALIIGAAENSHDGIVRILESSEAITRATSVLSTVEGGRLAVATVGMDYEYGQYFDKLSGQWIDLTLQDAIIHELGHLARDHHDHVNNKVDDLTEAEATGTKYSPGNEEEAILVRNEIMAKYYGTPPRSEKEYLDGVRSGYENGATEGLDINPNFNPNGYESWILSAETTRAKINELPAEEIANAGPELQSLWEVRESAELFERQFNEIKDYGELATLSDDVRAIKDANSSDIGNEYSDEITPVVSTPDARHSFTPTPS